jgi:hypothetical protein
VIPGGRTSREPSQVERLLGQLQQSVDRSKADREAARTVRCDRRTPHPGHDYVATPRSSVDLRCPGLSANRSIAQLLADHPEYADLTLYGTVRLSLGVSAA